MKHRSFSYFALAGLTAAAQHHYGNTAVAESQGNAAASQASSPGASAGSPAGDIRPRAIS
jgi:hypothetical protein